LAPEDMETHALPKDNLKYEHPHINHFAVMAQLYALTVSWMQG